MSVVELTAELTKLTPEERAEVREALDAMEEGVSVEELRRIDSALAQAEASFAAGKVRTLEQVKARFGLT